MTVKDLRAGNLPCIKNRGTKNIFRKDAKKKFASLHSCAKRNRQLICDANAISNFVKKQLCAF